MSGNKLYVNISSEQDLITLLGSRIVQEFQSLNIDLEGLLLKEKDDAELRALLAGYGIPLRHVPYTRTRACLSVSRVIRKLRKVEYYGRSSFDSTLYAKSKMGYRERTHSLPKFFLMKLFSKPFLFLRRFHPLIIGAYHRRVEGLPDLDAPVISLDYIHNDDHLELSLLCRRRREPYLTYVANLDQITNYDIHLDIPDRILVWGGFHQRVFTDRYGFRPEKIEKVGFCRSDRIAGISASGPGSLNVVYFCANTPANDPFLEENLLLMFQALEAKGVPYGFTIKKHPVNEKGVWERYQKAVQSIELKHGTVTLLASTWEKYSKIEGAGLGKKDFSYRDLTALLASASHVFSATSTTTLEAAIAGAPAYFLNIGRKLDGCFRFEHMRILMESGMVEMVTDPADFGRIFSQTGTKRLPMNPLMENIGTASRAFAETVAATLFKHGKKYHNVPSSAIR